MSPSRTFLFDNLRTGRLKYPKGSLAKPSKLWSVRLPGTTPYSPESTAVFDDKGNLYFGCHDGVFYSVTRNGMLRWKWKTGNKIYSSPLLYEDESAVCAVSGDGFFYCWSLEGALLWETEVGIRPRDWRTLRSWHRHKKASHPLHEVNRIASALAWSSPCRGALPRIYVTGYEHGLTCVDERTGGVLWRHALSSPRCCLAGVALAPDNSVLVCSQQNRLFRLNPDGGVIWERELEKGYNVWGSPGVDPETGNVYVVSSFMENAAVVHSYGLDGTFRWKSAMPSAVRGSVTIPRADYVAVCCFDGMLRRFRKSDGGSLPDIRVSSGCLWTTCGVDPNGYLLINTIDSDEANTGHVRCLDPGGKPVWEVASGKGHSVPVIDREGRLYAGSWNGDLICYQT